MPFIMTEIIEKKLYLGDYYDANNEKLINKLKINIIINMGADVAITNGNNVKIINYRIYDNEKFDISKYFEEISELINKLIEIESNVVLVNCVLGQSRSPSFIIAYLMKYHSMTLLDAFTIIKSKRQCILPNLSFMKQLIEYELKLFDKNSLTFDNYKKSQYLQNN